MRRGGPPGDPGRANAVFRPAPARRAKLILASRGRESRLGYSSTEQHQWEESADSSSRTIVRFPRHANLFYEQSFRLQARGRSTACTCASAEPRRSSSAISSSPEKRLIQRSTRTRGQRQPGARQHMRYSSRSIKASASTAAARHPLGWSSARRGRRFQIGRGDDRLSGRPLHAGASAADRRVASRRPHRRPEQRNRTYIRLRARRRPAHGDTGIGRKLLRVEITAA